MALKERLNIEKDKEMRKQLSDSQQELVQKAVREAVELAKEQEAKRQLEIELRAREAENKLRDSQEANEKARLATEKLAQEKISQL